VLECFSPFACGYRSGTGIVNDEPCADTEVVKCLKLTAESESVASKVKPSEVRAARSLTVECDLSIAVIAIILAIT